MDAALVMPQRRLYPRVWMVLIVLSVLVFCINGWRHELHVLRFRDFKEPYGGARCLLLHCDPYDSAQVHAAWHDAGGIDLEPVAVVPYTSLYPPFALAVLTPVAALPLPLAHDVWKALIAVLYSVATVLIAMLTLEFGAAPLVFAGLIYLTVTSTVFLMLGQISGVAIPLTVIGMYCVLRQRYASLAVVSLFLASMLKPQETGFLMLYLLFTHAFGRRVFLWVSATSLIFVGVSLLWISSFPAGANWFGELRANLHGAFLPDQVNSATSHGIHALEVIQLGALFGVVDPHRSLLTEIGVPVLSAVLLAAWIIPVLRLRDTFTKHVLAIAAVACYSLLPVYHRQYDSRLLLLVFPALAYLVAQPKPLRAFGYVGAWLVALTVVVTSHPFMNFVEVLLREDIERAGMLKTLLLYRPMPVMVLVVCLYFTAALYRQVRLERHPVAMAHVIDTSAGGAAALLK